MKRNNGVFALLILPAILGVFGLLGYGFFFKSGTAGFGIIMALFIIKREGRKAMDAWALVGAFAFSIAGDWFLSNRDGDTDRFVIGIALFFVAHIGYLTYALLNGKMKKRFTAVFTVAFLAYYAVALFPAIDELTLNIAVLVYLLISCLSFGIAMGFEGNAATRRAYQLGIFLVLFSDTIISIKEFVGIAEVDGLILPTYYLAHIAVIFAMMRKSTLFGSTVIN